jgi:gluconolactonase
MNSSYNPLTEFVVDRAAIQFVGQDLQRPECILAEPDGTLWSADARGGVVRIATNGAQQFIGQRIDDRFTAEKGDDAQSLKAQYTQHTLPNGMAFARNGDILIANFGANLLEVMTRDGESKTLFDRIDGRPIGKVNFVLRDSKNRIWLTISTRVNPGVRPGLKRIDDGYIAVVEDGQIRVVADGFYFTNEVRLDAREEWLYVAETTGPRISRMRLDESNPAAVMLTDRQVFGPQQLPGLPDGIAFDAYGNLWCTLIMVDQLIALTPEGEVKVLLDDGDPAASANLMSRFQSGTLRTEDMQQAKGTIAPWMASVTFGGHDLRTAYIGSLLGSRIAYFQSPVAGLPMVHWRT